MSSGTLTADGNTTPEDHNGYVWVHASGTFGGGTLALQYLGADGTYRDVATLTANGQITHEFAGPGKVRLNLTGSTTPSIFYEVQSGYRQ